MPSLSETVARVKAHFKKERALENSTIDVTYSSCKGKGNGKAILDNGKKEAGRSSTDATAEHAEFIDTIRPPKVKSNKKVTFTSAPVIVHTYEHPSDYHYDFEAKKEDYRVLQRKYGGKMRCEGLCRKRRVERMMVRRSSKRNIMVAGNLFM